MKSTTRLDSAVFQLTPTRTRCDLVITANGKTEKIASGLVNPFLAHLKTAQDQMAKGGYSIILELEPGIDSSWFTRGTVERFVRFVSTPEILERVYTLESEILQIEEAIAIQSNNDVGLETVEDHPVKTSKRIEGSKPLPDTNEKAIVIYKPGIDPAEANGSTEQEENSKVQLMKVLETRKSVLQKEQGMAFARAVAAGFDIDHIPPLMSFAQTFGASRLLGACMRFEDLWKRKHENGQWVEIEAAEAMSNRSDFGAMNASGIVLSNSVNKQWPSTPESNGKMVAESSADEKSPLSQQPSVRNQEYFQGQFPNPAYPSWPIQSPPGTMPVFPGYPMQFPYYQNYPGNGPPFFSPPYPSDAGQRKGLRRQSMDPETGDVDLELNQEAGRNSSRSSKKKQGKVVIRNINYITSKRHEYSSGTEPETDEEHLQKNSKKKGIHTDELVLYNEEGTNRNEACGRNWEAFQSYLLEGAVDDAENKDMFATEKAVRVKTRQQRPGDDDDDDPLLLEGRRVYDNEGGNMTDMARISGKNLAHMRRVSNDESLSSRQMGQSSDDGVFIDTQSEIDGRRERYRTGNDDFMIHRQANESDYVSNTVDLDSEMPLSQLENSGKTVASKVNYEPDDFSLIPEPDSDKGLVGYYPALDYEAENGIPFSKQESKKVDKNSKSRLVSDTLDKKKTVVGPIRKGKPSKSSPLEEARARAEKLRNYKADLQKIKKEKEEQEIKLLEALKLERQKRISSRGGSIPAMPTSQQNRKQLPAKLLPSPHKSSKFSDSETGSVSPLQRSKAGKLSTNSQSSGNRLSRSVSSLPEPKKENNTMTPDGKASMARIRRLSEPKLCSINSPVSSLKSRKIEPILKPKVSSAPEIKKLSAIVNYDKNKIASLPELKIRTTKGSDFANGKSLAKELPQNVDASKSDTTSKVTGLKRNSEKSSQCSDGDDNPIIEKKVLIQECDKSSIPAVWTEENKGVIGHSSNYKVGENTDSMSIPAPVSQPNMDVIDKKSCENRVLVLPDDVYKGTTEIASTAEKELPKLSSVTPYQAPFARNDSMEDSCTRNSEYGKAPLSIKSHLSDRSVFKLEKIPEVLDKPQTKGSSKGFRRLLKFGKKNHSPSESNAGSDNVNINGLETDDGAANIASSSEVNTLKNLISQHETPQKTSRHFSLLSPFRSKSSEKKLST